MIAKITSGGGFRGVLDYLMNQKKQQKESEKSLEKAASRTPETVSEMTPEHEGMQRINATKVRKQAVEKEPSGELRRGQKAAERIGLDGELSGREHSNLAERAARHRVIGGNMSGQTPRELAQEFGAFQEQRPDIQKPVHHASLSAAKNEKLPIEKWNQIAEKYVEKMGFGNSPYIVIQHLDTEHDHIHIVTSRIDTNGKIVSDFQSKTRAEKIMREVELEHDLQRVMPSREIERRAPTRGELEELSRTGERSAKMRLQDTIDRALRNQPDVAGFISQLDKTGVKINPNLQSTDRVSGVSFEHDGEVLKGSNLGRGYSWQGLQKRGLNYDQQRDLVLLKEAKVKYLEAQLERQQEAADRLNKEASPMQIISSLNPMNIAKAQLERYTSVEHFAQALNPINSITNHPIVQAARAVKEYAEQRQQATLSSELIEETKREIVELRQSLSAGTTPAWEQRPEQEIETQFDMKRKLSTPEPVIDAPVRPIIADVYSPTPVQNQILSQYQAAIFDPWQTLGNQQIGREALQSLSGTDQNISGQEILAKASGYDPNRSAEELLSEAIQPAYQRAEECDAPEQRNPVEIAQSPEIPIVEAVTEEIEIEEEMVMGLEMFF